MCAELVHAAWWVNLAVDMLSVCAVLASQKLPLAQATPPERHHSLWRASHATCRVLSPSTWPRLSAPDSACPLSSRSSGSSARRTRSETARNSRGENEEEQAATALVLLALTMPATNCLRSFLERSGKDELSASATDSAVAATVDRFLAMTTAQTVRLLEPRRAVEAARLRAAQAFSIEHGVHVWLAERNTAGGVAPVVSNVLERRHELAAACGHAAGSRLQCGKWGYYKWVARWRRKWRVQKARAHPRDVLETAVARKKAPDRL